MIHSLLNIDIYVFVIELNIIINMYFTHFLKLISTEKLVNNTNMNLKHLLRTSFFD